MLAGYARFPARGSDAIRTGLDARPVPVEQDGAERNSMVRPALLLMAGQLIEPFQAQR